MCYIFHNYRMPKIWECFGTLKHPLMYGLACSASDGKLGGVWVQAMESWVGPGNEGTLMSLGSAVLTQQSLEIKLISSAPAATSALITEQPIGKYQISEFSIQIAQVHGTEFN